jgi:hypothetical protein
LGRKSSWVALQIGCAADWNQVLDIRPTGFLLRRIMMAKTRRTFPPDFKAEAGKLITEQGPHFVEVAHEYR